MEKKDTLQYVRFDFLGWSDKSLEKQFEGNLSYWAQESAAMRGPTPFRDCPFILFETENDNEESENEIQLNVRVKIMYDAERDNPAIIKTYLERAGLLIGEPEPKNGILVSEEETPTFKKALFSKWKNLLKKDDVWNAIDEELK